MLPDPLVHGLPELGTALAKCNGQVAAGLKGDVPVHIEAGEDLLPEIGQIVVDDGDRCETGVDHLEDVVVFEDVGRLLDHHGRLAARFQLLVQADDVPVIDAGLADEHLLTRQIVERRDARRARTGDDHFADVGARRLRESRDFLQLRPDRDHGRDHVNLAAFEGLVQLIARQRHDHHVHLQVPRLQLGVQVAFERLQGFIGDSALLPPVDEVVRAVERHGHANRAVLDHPVEVAGERRVHQEPNVSRQGIER